MAVPNYKNKKYLTDLAERVGWTCAQVALGLISVEAFDLPTWAVIPVATALAALKGYVAKHVGSSNTAALLPSKDDTPDS